MHLSDRSLRLAILCLFTLSSVTGEGEGPAETKDTSPLNYFINPGPQGQDNFIPGEIIHVAFETNFKDPWLTLFCGGLKDPITSAHVTKPGYDLPGQNAKPFPNCYFQIQEGEGAPNAQPSFGTGIFAIGNGTEEGRVLNSTQQTGCNCPTTCGSPAAGSSGPPNPSMMRQKRGHARLY